MKTVRKEITYIQDLMEGRLSPGKIFLAFEKYGIDNIQQATTDESAIKLLTGIAIDHLIHDLCTQFGVPKFALWTKWSIHTIAWSMDGKLAKPSLEKLAEHIDTVRSVESGLNSSLPFFLKLKESNLDTFICYQSELNDVTPFVIKNLIKKESVATVTSRIVSNLTEQFNIRKITLPDELKSTS